MHKTETDSPHKSQSRCRLVAVIDHAVLTNAYCILQCILQYKCVFSNFIACYFYVWYFFCNFAG